MKALTEAEAIAWSTNRWCGALDKDRIRYGLPEFSVFKLPRESGRKTFMTKFILGTIEEPSDCVIWYTDWGIWDDLPEIIRNIRVAHGEARPLIEAPAHLVSQEEPLLTEALLGTAMHLYYDAFFIPGSREVIVKTSHDEYVALFGNRDNTAVVALDEALSKEFERFE
jgi:hypothetical protein